VQLDHVLIRVADLYGAAREIETRHGLPSIEGGRHPGWGTANRIVPLHDAYLELVAVVDEEEAAFSPFGRWVASAKPGKPFGWAVRTGHLDEVAHRLNLTIVRGSRATPGGRRAEWRTAGFEQAGRDPSLPFFIEWAPNTPFPGNGGDARVDHLELVGDPTRLADRLGEGQNELPIVVREGPPRVASVVLADGTTLP